MDGLSILILLIEISAYAGCFQLLFVSLRSSLEGTMLQINTTIPAWELVAVISCIGLFSFFFAMSNTVRQLKKRKKKHSMKVLEEKIDALTVLLHDTNRLLKKVSEPTIEIPDDMPSEGLPYEDLEDFLEMLSEMVSENQAPDSCVVEEIPEPEVTESESVPVVVASNIIPNDRIRTEREKQTGKKKRKR